MSRDDAGSFLGQYKDLDILPQIRSHLLIQRVLVSLLKSAFKKVAVRRIISSSAFAASTVAIQPLLNSSTMLTRLRQLLAPTRPVARLLPHNQHSNSLN